MSTSSSISPLISSSTKYSHFVMPLKMIKAVKKLKFWSRKKRKRNSYEPYYPPPPTCYHHCCSCSSTQPSAPPLPPWLEVEQTHDAISAPSVQPLPEVAYPSQPQFTSQEIVIETSPIYPTLPSYQQYMVPDPVYGMPVVQPPRKERSAGFFSCLVNFGVHLIRCFCPCFRIRDVY